MLQYLQMCRGLAALAVCLFHASGIFNDPRFGSHLVLADYTRLGYVGVDFFFALSGFIILFAHQADINRPSALKAYALKRFIRIYPLYWVVYVCILVMAFVSGGESTPPSTFGDTATSTLLLKFTSYSSPVHPAWTLFHEVFFYLLFALSIWRKRVGTIALIVWAAVLIFPAVLAPLPAFLKPLVALVTAPVNICFFGGMGAFLLYKRYGLVAGAVSSVLGFLVLVYVLAFLSPDWNLFMFKFLLACAFMLFLSGISAVERVRGAIAMPLLTLIGNASFMLYLTHENVQSTAIKLLYYFGAYNSLDERIVFCIIMLASVGAGIVGYVLIEKPMLRWLRGRLMGRRGQAPLKPSPGMGSSR